jgi:hypothetical protein
MMVNNSTNINKTNNNLSPKECSNSEGQRFVDIGGIVDLHCFLKVRGYRLFC